MLAIVDRWDFNPATNEIVIGSGDTGAQGGIEAIALNPADGELYAVDYNFLGTFQADGTFIRYPEPVGWINGPYGSYEVIDVDGLSFEPGTGILWASVRTYGLPTDVIIQLDVNTGKAVPGVFGGDDYIPVPDGPDHYHQRAIDDLAFHPFDGRLFATLNRSGRRNTIVEIDKATGNTINLGNIHYPAQGGIVEDVEGLEFDPDGILWGTTGNKGTPAFNDKLWKIDWNASLSRFEVDTPRPLTYGTDYEALTFCSWRHEPVTAFSRWLLPAGATEIDGVVFDTYILVSNPNPKAAPVSITFVGENGPVAYTTRTLLPRSRMTIKINDYVAPSHAAAGAVSTIVRSLDLLPIHAERAMYFKGGSGPSGWSDGHNTIGIDHPATEWNLPEGATHMFDQFIHVLNPGDTPTIVTAIFINQAGFTWQTQTLVESESNWTIHVNDEVGEQTQVSTRVTSESPVAVDRTMYWNKGGASVWTGGHASRGISRPSTVWHLAEGANHLFDHYVLLSNPSVSESAAVRLTFMDADGNTAVHTHTLAPRSRYTFKVNDLAGWEEKGQISTRVESKNDVSIFAERAMYWPKGGPWKGGHNSIGISLPAVRWHLPEGANHLFDHYVLVSNPSATETSEVVFTFMDQSGQTAVHSHSVGPMSRYTVKVNNIPGWGNRAQVSTVVESVNSIPVIVERAMYLSPGGQWTGAPGQGGQWAGGHGTVGIPELLPYSLTRQYHPAGSESENVLVYNPSTDTVARIGLEVITASGDVSYQEYEIEPMTSRVVRVKERGESPDRPLGADQAAAPVVVESSIPVVVKGGIYRSGGYTAGGDD